MQDSLDFTLIIISSIALVTSIITAIYTYIYSRKQTKLMKDSLNLGVSSQMFTEFRKKEFKDAVWFIYQNASSFTMPNYFMSKDPQIEQVCYFFDHLGILVKKKITDEDIIIAFMGGTILKVWESVKVFIENERNSRSNPKF